MADKDDESADLSMLTTEDQALYRDLKRRESINHGQVRLSRQGGLMPGRASEREAFLTARDAAAFTYQDAATLRALETKIYGQEQADINAGLRSLDPARRQRAELERKGFKFDVAGSNRRGMDTTWTPEAERRRRAAAVEEDNRRRNHQAFLADNGLTEDQFTEMSKKTAAFRDWFKNYGGTFWTGVEAATNLGKDDFMKLPWADRLRISEGILGLEKAEDGKYKVVSDGTKFTNPAKPDGAGVYNYDWWRS